MYYDKQFFDWYNNEYQPAMLIPIQIQKANSIAKSRKENRRKKAESRQITKAVMRKQNAITLLEMLNNDSLELNKRINKLNRIIRAKQNKLEKNAREFKTLKLPKK